MPDWSLLIPMLWLATVSSRPYSFWLAWLGLGSGTSGNPEGNPVDLVIMLMLLITALLVLKRRGFLWGSFVTANKMLILAYVFLALSSFWSEFGFSTFKRVVKDFGSAIAALVILTEARPFEAARLVVVRVAYVLLPLSVVFIKYFPSIGRTVSRGGDNMACGVSMHKSSLGALVFLFSLFIVLDLLELVKKDRGRARSLGIMVRIAMLLIGAWLVAACQSATSVVCFVLGCLVLWGSGRLAKMRNPVKVIVSVIILGIGLLSAEQSFDLSGSILEALGKDRTLTGRTQIWEMAGQARIDPLLGCGYFTFWQTEEAERIQKEFVFMNSAHNGFIDMYLGGGYVGVLLLLGLLAVWTAKSMRLMLAGSLYGRMAFTILVSGIVFNNSETAFFRLDPSWFLMLLMLMNCPMRTRSAERTQFAPSRGHVLSEA